VSLNTLQKIIDSGVKLTPMMEQYYKVKKNHPDTILLFRMGDFYEVFFEDADETSKLLNIAKTHRGKLGDQPIPMAGIPHHAASAYMDKLTSFGKRVAICEQVENPKDAVGIVKREVTQIVSPALPYDMDKTSPLEQQFILATTSLENKRGYHLVALDFTTGEFFGHEVEDLEEFYDLIRKYHPKELITFMGQWENDPRLNEILEKLGTLKTFLSMDYFEVKNIVCYLEKLIPLYKSDKILAQIPAILSPAGALAYYICSTQGSDFFSHIRPFRLQAAKNIMRVSAATLTGLEILPKSKETYRESLLGFFDKTQTAMGARKLRQIFLCPLMDLSKIVERQNSISYFLENIDLLKAVRLELQEIRDNERIIAKVSTQKANSGDLLNLAKSIDIFFSLAKKLAKTPFASSFKVDKEQTKILTQLAQDISLAINDEIGASLEKGNLLKQGWNPDRDRLARISQKTNDELLKLEEQYREKTGILKLKVKRNNVAGLFIEVSKSHTNKVPKSFERRQTLVNAERYITSELTQFEKELVSAQDRLHKLEREILREFFQRIGSLSSSLFMLGDVLSTFDCLQSLAWVAFQESYVKPKLETQERMLHIENGHHPLIKNLIKDRFVPHSIHLDKHSFFGLITGPNMAGKTTVMREIAIIQFLAQIGSFVPASTAHLGLCDFLFSRLGASDDIQRGQSTFMVEMSETAEIIRHASKRSLVILDEVGRGTSTYDGLSIAWALVEHFTQKIQAFTLFATHYHELIDLAVSLDGAKNFTVATKGQGTEVQFLYQLVEGGASQSYGIYVAKLAGIPKSILKRSEEILCNLEKNGLSGHDLNDDKSAAIRAGTQLSFFTEGNTPAAQKIPEYLKEIEDSLAQVNINQLTPLDALIKLKELTEQINLQ